MYVLFQYQSVTFRIRHENWCLPFLQLSCEVLCQITNSHEDSYWQKAVCLPFMHIQLQPILQLTNSHEESCRRKTICLPFVQILLQPFIQLESASTKRSQDWTQNVAVSFKSSSIIDYIGVFLKEPWNKSQIWALSKRCIYCFSIKTLPPNRTWNLTPALCAIIVQSPMPAYKFTWGFILVKNRLPVICANSVATNPPT